MYICSADVCWFMENIWTLAMEKLLRIERCIKHFEISLALTRNTTGTILLIKFEINREMYVEIPRYLYVF